MSASFPPPPQVAASGRATQARAAKTKAIKRWLDYQDLIDNELRDPSTPTLTLTKLIEAQARCAEQIRLLKGLVKPGSRNISVRELSKEEREERAAAKARGTGPISVFAAPEAPDAAVQGDASAS